jgi:hypothetical protein
MAYVAVSGGKEAIEASIELLRYYRSGTEKDVAVEAIENKLSLLVDAVMSEAGLYSKTYAALALKQCEGSVQEAVFLLRAYRSTLTRNYYTNVADTENMRVVRRISSAFKDITGGQILGATYDYTHRLINFELGAEDPNALYSAVHEELGAEAPQAVAPCPRVSDALKEEGLIDGCAKNDDRPDDVTESLLEFPASRSSRAPTRGFWAAWRIRCCAASASCTRRWASCARGTPSCACRICSTQRKAFTSARFCSPRSSAFRKPTTATNLSLPSATARCSAETRTRQLPWPSSTTR